MMESTPLLGNNAATTRLPKRFGFFIMVALALCLLTIVVVVSFQTSKFAEYLTDLRMKVVLGVLNSLMGSLLTASGYCCQKWAHVTTTTGIAVTTNRIYLLGLFLLVIGTISAVVNLGLLGQTVQSPFAALTLVYNSILAYTVLEESYDRVDVYSSLLIISGVLVSVLGVELSPEKHMHSQVYSTEGLVSMYWTSTWLPSIYSIVVVSSAMLSLHFVNANKESEWGLLCYSGFGGLMAGFTSLAVKSTLEVVKASVNVLQNPMLYVFAGCIPLALLPQLYCMNQGLRHFSTLQFVPLYQSFIILANFLCGVVFMNEMSTYAEFSIVFFVCGCAITTAGVWLLLLKVHDARRAAALTNTTECKVNLKEIPWVTDEANVKFLHHFGECQEAIVNLFQSARDSIFYSTFLCDFFYEMPMGDGSNVTMLSLIKEASARGVRIHILYNPFEEYGTSSVQQLLNQLPSSVSLHSSISNLGPNAFTQLLFNNAKYGYHHQKYLCQDGNLPGGRVMVTGCDVNSERAAWLVTNSKGSYWHEVSVVFDSTRRIFDWIFRNHFSKTRPIFDDGFLNDFTRSMMYAPFPIINGGWNEENIMVELIRSAKESVHIENQIFISGGNLQENRIVLALVERLVKSVEQHDSFCAFILTNNAQEDEPSLLSRLYCKVSLEYSMQCIVQLSLERGLKSSDLQNRVAICRLENKGRQIKVHSNICIQDSVRCIRTSSNLADRSLSHLPCDAEAGILVQGACVAKFQQSVFNMYLNTLDGEYSVRKVVQLLACGNIGCLKKLKLNYTRSVALEMKMAFFVHLSQGAVGGKYPVTLSTKVESSGRL